MNRQPTHTVHLHGSLARFGESYRLAVNTPREAIRALAMQIEGFGEAVKSGMFRLVRGKDPEAGMHYEVPFDAEKKQYDVSMLFFSLGKDGEDFHIVPVIAGAGGGGGGKIIIGAVIMTAAVVGAFFSGGATLGALSVAGEIALDTGIVAGMSASAFMGVTWGQIAVMGAAMMLGGIAQILQPSIKANYANSESADQRASFFLGGQVNQASQGGPVILAYGRCRVGSTVVSAGLTAERLGGLFTGVLPGIAASIGDALGDAQ